MTPRRVLVAAAALPALLLASGCTSSDDGGTGGSPAAGTSAPGSSAPGSSAAGTSAADSSAPAPPPPAGEAEAEALASLPEGPAAGTAVLAYSGVGEVRAPFSGECTHDGDATRLEGSADTARIRLDVAPDGAQLTLDDVGLSATSDVATGRYDVEGNHLSLSAALLSGDQTIGRVELEVDCGR